VAHFFEAQRRPAAAARFLLAAVRATAAAMPAQEQAGACGAVQARLWAAAFGHLLELGRVEVGTCSAALTDAASLPLCCCTH
jgi:hypothetical protein